MGQGRPTHELRHEMWNEAGVKKSEVREHSGWGNSKSKGQNFEELWGFEEQRERKPMSLDKRGWGKNSGNSLIRISALHVDGEAGCWGGVADKIEEETEARTHKPVKKMGLWFQPQREPFKQRSKMIWFTLQWSFCLLEGKQMD